jgi:hypothetical protein
MRVQKNKPDGLFFLLMDSLLAADRAVLLDFHLLGMLALVAGADIVFFTADRALEGNILSSHL